MTNRAQDRRRLIDRTLNEILTSATVWCWGDDGGIVPWTDRDGHLVVAVWPSAEAAQTECSETAEDGETALPFPLPDFIERMNSFRNSGVEEVAVAPKNGRILLTVSLDEFRAILEGEPPTRPVLP